MDIKRMPLEIIFKMIERQVEQENLADTSKLNNNKTGGGFDWERTLEGFNFWDRINFGDYNEFYKKYPKNIYPKIMRVSFKPIKNGNTGVQRVVFMEKEGYYYAWEDAETFEDAEKIIKIVTWNCAKDIEETPIKEITLTEDEIQEAIKEYIKNKK